MEDFSNEIVELICNEWGEDEDLVTESLFYLYRTTNDKGMENEIDKVFNEMGICPNCGNKLLLYEWSEPHTELDGSPLEWFRTYDCPCCGDMSSRYLKEE